MYGNSGLIVVECICVYIYSFTYSYIAIEIYCMGVIEQFASGGHLVENIGRRRHGHHGVGSFQKPGVK